MHYFVSGVSGFIGSNLAYRLAEMNKPEPHRLNGEILKGETVSVPRVGREMRQYLRNSELPKDVDVAIHLAGIAYRYVPEGTGLQESNVDAPLLLFEKLADQGVKQFVYASAIDVYGNLPVPFREDGGVAPLTPFARTKATFDDKCMEFASKRGVNVVGLRFSEVYGPGEQNKGGKASLVRHCITSVSLGNRMEFYWDGSQETDWLYINDAIDAILLATQFKEGGAIFNIGSDDPQSLEDLGAMVAAATKHRFRSNYVVNPHFEQYQFHRKLDISQARARLNYKPQYDLRSGIDDYLKRWT